MTQQRLKNNQKRKVTYRKIVNVELDTKCSCPQPTSNNNASIQFTRRYLQCYSTMPIRIIRLLIGTILPHSPMIEVSIFDSNDRLLKDSDRLYSLKPTDSWSDCISLRFTMINTITSFAHCSCLSPLIETDLSSLPTIIQPETIDQILSTCSIVQTTVPSSPSSLSSIDTCQPPFRSGFLIDCEPDESTMDLITSEFGEICPDYPLDLSMKSQTKWIKT